MATTGGTSGGSILLAEEYFQAEDDRFVDALRDVRVPASLAPLADRWNRDPRPWARRQKFVYLSKPLDSVGHNTVVKRLLRHAESSGDDEIMAALVVVFDRLVRRQRKRRWQYDWQTRQSWEEEYLAAPSNTLPLEPTRKGKDPRTGRPLSYPVHVPPNGRLFSNRTRTYLRRRAWRYFRRLGFQYPQRYVPAIVRALAAYQDEDVVRGENLLDSWGLMQACFRLSDVLEFGAVNIRVREGRSLNELQPAPRFPDLWRKPEAMAALMGLVAAAGSRFVRLWAMQWLQAEQAAALSQLPVNQILPLFEHPDEEVQQFAANLFLECRELASLPMETWFTLLETKSLAALESIGQAMRRHVHAERLTLADCVRLACSEPAPVAQLGLDYLKQREYSMAADRQALAGLADARCFALLGAIADWALVIVGTSEAYDQQSLIRYFDSLQRPVREAAWRWLDRPDSPGYGDPVLWSRLLETPYDDLRLALIESLNKRSSLPGVSADDLTPVWCSVLAGVHRGGRQKAKAVRQIGEAIVKKPSRAASLVPVLAVAVRSVRGPELRAGLAALVAAVESRPEIAEEVRRHFPELSLNMEEVGA